MTSKFCLILSNSRTCSTPIDFAYIKNGIFSSLQSSKIDTPGRYTMLPVALSTQDGTPSVGWVAEPYFKCVDFLFTQCHHCDVSNFPENYSRKWLVTARREADKI